MDIIEQAFKFNDDGECFLSKEPEDYVIDERIAAIFAECDERDREFAEWESELAAEDEEEVSLDDDDGIMDFD